MELLLALTETEDQQADWLHRRWVRSSFHMLISWEDGIDWLARFLDGWLPRDFGEFVGDSLPDGLTNDVAIEILRELRASIVTLDDLSNFLKRGW